MKRIKGVTFNDQPLDIDSIDRSMEEVDKEVKEVYRDSIKQNLVRRPISGSIGLKPSSIVEKNGKVRTLDKKEIAKEYNISDYHIDNFKSRRSQVLYVIDNLGPITTDEIYSFCKDGITKNSLSGILSDLMRKFKKCNATGIDRIKVKHKIKGHPPTFEYTLDKERTWQDVEEEFLEKWSSFNDAQPDNSKIEKEDQIDASIDQSTEIQHDSKEDMEQDQLDSDVVAETDSNAISQISNILTNIIKKNTPKEIDINVNVNINFSFNKK